MLNAEVGRITEKLQYTTAHGFARDHVARPLHVHHHDPWRQADRHRPVARGQSRCARRNTSAIDKADVILLSHGHSDHSGDVVNVARATGAPVVADSRAVDVAAGRRVCRTSSGMGIGGTVSVAGLEITMTPAVHSQQRRRERHHRLSRRADRVRRPDGGRPRVLFRRRHGALRRHAADRAKCYTPEIAFLPIGDHYTMGPEAAARGGQLLRRPSGRADALRHLPGPHRTPEQLKALVEPMGVTSCAQAGRNLGIMLNVEC